MKTMRPIKKILLALGAMALAVGGAVFAQSKPVLADDASETHILLPGFTEHGQTDPFNTNPNATNINATNLDTYNSLEMSFGSGQSQAWSDTAAVTFDHSWTMSFWTLVGNNDGSTINDGMALVFQPTSNNTTIKTKDGQSLGVYGYADSTVDSTSTVAGRAIQKSVAIEFDHNGNTSYNSTDGFDYKQGSSNHIALTYPGASSSYGKVGAFLGAGAYYLNHIKPNIPMTNGYQWRHVTITYVDNEYNSNAGQLSYYYDDRNRTTNQPQAISSPVNVTLDFSKMAGKSTPYYFGFTSYDKAGGIDTGKNRVILDTFSDFVTTTASAKLIDKSSTATDKEVKTDGIVYGGDELEYTYTITNSSNSSRSLESAMLQSALPDSSLINWTSATVKTSDGQTGSMKIADIQSNTGAKVIGSLPKGQTATITVEGTANQVTDLNGKTVVATDWQFRNGGAESYMFDSHALENVSDFDNGQYLENQQQTPKFKIMPGVKTTSTASIKDIDEVGSPTIPNAHVFYGDRLAYTFDVKLDADSPLDWNNTITAKLDMPSEDLLSYLDLNSNAKPFHVEAVEGSGKVVKGDYTYQQLEAGVPVTDSNGLSKNPITNHITVTVTVAASGGKLPTNGSTAIPSATATFESTLHTATATAANYTILTANTPNTDAPTVTPDMNTIDVDQIGDAAEGSNYVNLSGYYDDSMVTDDGQMTFFVAAGSQDATGKWTYSGKHIQLKSGHTAQDGHTGRYNLSLSKPDLTKIVNTFNSQTTPASQGQALDTSTEPWLTYGKNEVSIYAVDSQGRSTEPKKVIINVGFFKFMDASDITFPTTTLTGTQRVVGADKAPTLTINNSLGNQWNVKATSTDFKAGDKTLKGTLYYVDKEDNVVNRVALNDQSASITDSSLLSTNSKDNYNVDLSSGWNASQPTADTID